LQANDLLTTRQRTEALHKEEVAMTRNLLATMAVATLVTAGAFAQETTLQPAPAPATPPATEQIAPPTILEGQAHLTTNFIGETVYDGIGDDAQNIGDVNDLVFDKDGKVESIVIGVGGFLGIGEKNVALEYGKARWAERDGDRWVIVEATKEELDAMPAFDRTPYDPAPALAPEATGSTTPAPTAPAQ
jgi:sporulation protein YlmC with PRC-barrel domain